MKHVFHALSLATAFGFLAAGTMAAEPVATNPYGQPSPYAPPSLPKAPSQLKLEKTLAAHPEILLTLVEVAAQLDEPSIAQKANIEQAGYSQATRQRAAKSNRANLAILAMGTVAVPGLIELLDDDRAAVRTIAVIHLAWAARHPDFPADTVLPALTRVARNDKNTQIRQEAQSALSHAVQLVSHPGFRETINKDFDAQLNKLD